MDKRILERNWTMGNKELESGEPLTPDEERDLSIATARTMRRTELNWAKHYKATGNETAARLSVKMAYVWRKKLHALLNKNQTADIVARELEQAHKRAAWMDEAEAEHADWLDLQATQEGARF